MAHLPATFIVEDDPLARESLHALARSMHIPAHVFASAEEFLNVYRGEPGCVVTDYRLTGLNGLELQEELRRRGYLTPVVIVTGHARTPLTVRAIKAGAVTILEKPYQEDELWEAIREGFAQDAARRDREQQLEETRQRFESLNEKERVVLELIVQGKPNKAMAGLLDVSLRTIENRRRSVFEKIGVGSVAELVALKLRMESEMSPRESANGRDAMHFQCAK